MLPSPLLQLPLALLLLPLQPQLPLLPQPLLPPRLVLVPVQEFVL